MVYCRFLVVVRLFRLRGIMQTNRPTWLHFAPSRNERAEYGSNLLDRLVKDLKERMASGRDQYIEKCRREGIKMGRPSTYRKSINEYKKQYQREFSLIRKGLSLANISAITGTSINTIRINFYYIFFLQTTTTEQMLCRLFLGHSPPWASFRGLAPQKLRPINRDVVCQSATVGSLCKRGCGVVQLFYFLTMGQWEIGTMWFIIVLSFCRPALPSSHPPIVPLYFNTFQSSNTSPIFLYRTKKHTKH